MSVLPRDRSASGYRQTRVKTRQLWELLFSWHLSLAAVTASLSAWAVAGPLAQMEMGINHFLHISQTDYVRGHLMVWIPTALVSLSVWAFLRAVSDARATEGFLRMLAGLITLATPSAFWIFAYKHNDWPLGWPQYLALFETIGILICALFFLNGRWKPPKWTIFLVLALHYGLWYAAGGANLFFAGYAGPVAPIFGFSAAASWVAYLSVLGVPKATSAYITPA